MPDDRMKNDDLQRNMDNKEGQDYGKQSPGRNDQADQHGGQHAGGKQRGQFGGQKIRDLEDEDLDTGIDRTSRQNRGGQNR